MKKIIYGILHVFYSPFEISELANSDLNWGKGYDEFFSLAFKKLEDGVKVKVPKKWQLSPNGIRYQTYADLS